jgi:hypothetical protein
MESYQLIGEQYHPYMESYQLIEQYHPYMESYQLIGEQYHPYMESYQVSIDEDISRFNYKYNKLLFYLHVPTTIFHKSTTQLKHVLVYEDATREDILYIIWNRPI